MLINNNCHPPRVCIFLKQNDGSSGDDASNLCLFVFRCANALVATVLSDSMTNDVASTSKTHKDERRNTVQMFALPFDSIRSRCPVVFSSNSVVCRAARI